VAWGDGAVPRHGPLALCRGLRPDVDHSTGPHRGARSGAQSDGGSPRFLRSIVFVFESFLIPNALVGLSFPNIGSDQFSRLLCFPFRYSPPLLSHLFFTVTKHHGFARFCARGRSSVRLSPLIRFQGHPKVSHMPHRYTGTQNGCMEVDFFFGAIPHHFHIFIRVIMRISSFLNHFLLDHHRPSKPSPIFVLLNVVSRQSSVFQIRKSSLR